MTEGLNRRVDRLEALVADQQARIDRQRETIRQQRERIEERGTHEVDYSIRSHVDGNTVSLWQCTALIEILIT